MGREYSHLNLLWSVREVCYRRSLPTSVWEQGNKVDDCVSVSGSGQFQPPDPDARSIQHYHGAELEVNISGVIDLCCAVERDRNESIAQGIDQVHDVNPSAVLRGLVP